MDAIKTFKINTVFLHVQYVAFIKQTLFKISAFFAILPLQMPTLKGKLNLI